jgi:6-pyruvoyl-tetrahydropterin synthase
LLDITTVQQALATVVEELRNRDLNDVPGMAPNTTAEVVARFIWRRVAPALPTAILMVRVWESPEAYASYSDAISRT